MEQPFREWLSDLGLTAMQVRIAVWATYIACVLLAAWIADLLTKKILVRWVKYVAAKNKFDATKFVIAHNARAR